MQMTQETRAKVEKIIKKRFADRVDRIDMEPSVDSEGDEILMIHVWISEGTTEKDLPESPLSGLTILVIDAMGEEMSDIFPIIRPMEAGAYAGY